LPDNWSGKLRQSQQGYERDGPAIFVGAQYNY
jgi:hypothetical protein